MGNKCKHIDENEQKKQKKEKKVTKIDKTRVCILYHV